MKWLDALSTFSDVSSDLNTRIGVQALLRLHAFFEDTRVREATTDEQSPFSPGAPKGVSPALRISCIMMLALCGATASTCRCVGEASASSISCNAKGKNPLARSRPCSPFSSSLLLSTLRHKAVPPFFTNPANTPNPLSVRPSPRRRRLRQLCLFASHCGTQRGKDVLCWFRLLVDRYINRLHHTVCERDNRIADL